MDVKLLPLVDRANSGDVDALWELASAYIYGQAVKEDKAQQKFYLLELTKKPDSQLPERFGYILSLLGDVCFNLREYEDAADWYMKAIDHFFKNFPIDKAREWISYFETEQGLCDAFYWDIRSKELAMESPD